MCGYINEKGYTLTYIDKYFIIILSMDKMNTYILLRSANLLGLYWANPLIDIIRPISQITHLFIKMKFIHYYYYMVFLVKSLNICNN